MPAIEPDSCPHTFEEVADRDEVKEQRLRESGVRVKRFRDEDVMNNIEGVIRPGKETHPLIPSQEGKIDN